jgi:cell wall-associated NlpC family hydrolase
MKLTLVGVLAAMLLVLGAPVAGGVAAVGALVGAAVAAPSEPAPASGPVPGVPVSMASLYQAAAVVCPGLPWTVLAAIGTVESDNGQSDLPGVHSGANAAGAEGLMQFEPATFAAYDEPVPPGGAVPPSPYDPTDAVYAAARLLCANGAAGGADLSAAVYAYNHSASYVAQVLALAQTYAARTAGGAGTGMATAVSATNTGAGALAVSWALSQIGTPYVWGGEMPGVGFDCSGLVQAAYAVAGVALPRVAQDQYDSTPKLGPGASLAPGDLVFFGGGPASIDHVGLFVGVVGNQDVMVDAPHTGADVRAEAFPATPGAAFGSLLFVGATRPG